MNGLTGALAEVRVMAEALEKTPTASRVALCPPTTLIARLSQVVADTVIEVGGQDCHAQPSGAHTGDVSAEMLADAGASLVILGHSERRADHGDTDASVAAKVRAAMRAALEPIICVGESLEQRKAGLAVATVRAQLRGSLPEELGGAPFAVAYEPIWAIGTGLVPTLGEIAEVHYAVRETLWSMFGAAGTGAPILYGGSVKGANAAEIMAVDHVNGALVGGASLTAADFLPIIQAV